MFFSRLESERTYSPLRLLHFFQMVIVYILEQTHEGLGNSISFNVI